MDLGRVCSGGEGYRTRRGWWARTLASLAPSSHHRDVDETSKSRMLRAWNEQSSELGSPPATEAELRAFESRYGPIPAEFRWFLHACGGGVVGSEWVDDVESLPASHDRFQEGKAIEHGWTMENVFIIGWDGGGSPMAIEHATGRVVVEHPGLDPWVLAPSFEVFLSQGLGLALVGL